MPAKTEKQRRFMGAELQRKREGKKTRTGHERGRAREDGEQAGQEEEGRLTEPPASTGVGGRPQGGRRLLRDQRRTLGQRRAAPAGDQEQRRAGRRRLRRGPRGVLGRRRCRGARGGVARQPVRQRLADGRGGVASGVLLATPALAAVVAAVCARRVRARRAGFADGCGDERARAARAARGRALDAPRDARVVVDRRDRRRRHGSGPGRARDPTDNPSRCRGPDAGGSRARRSAAALLPGRDSIEPVAPGAATGLGRGRSFAGVAGLGSSSCSRPSSRTLRRPGPASTCARTSAFRPGWPGPRSSRSCSR